jgi:Ca2+-dependent lipid-binding protein
VLTDLACTNLPPKDRNNFSDPYVKFTSPELFEDHPNYKTSVKLKELNPTWKDDELPELISRCSVDALVHAHLYMRVYDADKLSADDFIGTAVVHLEEALRASPLPVEFDLPLAFYTSITKGAGRIRGKIRIELPVVQAAATAKIEDMTLDAAQGARCIISV